MDLYQTILIKLNNLNKKLDGENCQTDTYSDDLDKQNSCKPVISLEKLKCIESHLNNLNEKFNCGYTNTSMFDTIGTSNDAINNSTNLRESDILTENLEYIELQLNYLNQKFERILTLKDTSDNRYKQLVSELETIYTILDNNYCPTKQDISGSDNCCTTRQVYTDIETEHHYIVNKDISYIFLTMVGGGGCGGIGYVDNFYYYSGSGGGSGACIFKKPISVCIGTVIKITVGKGGNSLTNNNGTQSSVKIIYPNGKCEVSCVDGGFNGNPSIMDFECNKLNDNVKGGKGGQHHDCCLAFLDGCSGEDGEVALPSFATAQPGNGGSSAFANGGKGGSNILSEGGSGGIYTDLVGKDGKFGSGGGGSCPRILKPEHFKDKLSGNGGNGLVIIE
jgi:hypothetical protein